jgi:hypothetical protein
MRIGVDAADVAEHPTCIMFRRPTLPVFDLDHASLHQRALGLLLRHAIRQRLPAFDVGQEAMRLRSDNARA